MAGIKTHNGLTLVSPNGLVEKVVTVGDDGVLTIESTPISLLPNSLFKEYEVTGAAVTSIDFTGLEIILHKSYRIELELINATASNSSINMFINGDTTLTNYYNEMIQANHATLASARYNSPECVGIAANSRAQADIVLSRDYAGYISARSITGNNFGSSVLTEFHTISKTATVTNIWQLTFAASVASSIGIGSKIRIYRGDV